MKAFAISLIFSFLAAATGGAYLLWEHHPDRALIERRMADDYRSFSDVRRGAESKNYLALYHLRLGHRRRFGSSVSLRRNLGAEKLESMRKHALEAQNKPKAPAKAPGRVSLAPALPPTSLALETKQPSSKQAMKKMRPLAKKKRLARATTSKRKARLVDRRAPKRADRRAASRS